jgi:transcription termination factor Rho
MREKYESLSAIVLKDLARARGLKNISNMKKSDLVELMLAEDERQAKEKAAQGEGAENQESTAKSSDTESTERKKRENVRGAERKNSHTEHSENAERRVLRAESTESAERRNSRIENTEEGSRRVPRTDGAERTAAQTRTVRTERPMRGGERPVKNTEEGVQSENVAREASPEETLANLDSGINANGILEVMPDGYGFIRCENYLPGENDVYVSPSQIRKFNLKTGDIISGNTRVKTQQEKFSALLYVTSINGYHPSVAQRRKNFEDLTPIFPNQRIRLERAGSSVAMRIVDLVSPIGKGQRGMIVSQPKAGKTTLLKEIAKSVTMGNPDMHLIILLIDERPEEVTDIKEAIEGENVEVIYSTFDELPEHHKRVSEMVIERAKRLVEHGRDVMILLDSITRLARAYNLTVPPSGRTLSGGLDPAALHMPKRFFGAARNMREGGSLTVLATALVDTGSKMDDVVFEEFKGTGNMELVLDRKLSEKRVFPAIDIVKSGTRRDDLLLDAEEQEAMDIMRKAINGMRTDEAVENILNMFARTRNNKEYIQMVKKNRVL